jgi:hypothetical protein
VGLFVSQPQSVTIATATRGLFAGGSKADSDYARRVEVIVTIKIMRRASLARNRTQPTTNETTTAG